MPTADELIAQALAATRESRGIEFRREFSLTVPGAVCELLRDVAALANSGGGVVIVGLQSDGSVSGWDPSDFLATDPAELTNAFSEYVGDQLDGLVIREAKKSLTKLVAIVVPPRAVSPVVFEKAGTYIDAQGREKVVFARGSISFRHGARSEPGTARDLHRFIAREVAREHRAWAKNIRSVAAAPAGSQVLVVKPKQAPTTAVAQVRVVDDPNAPAVARTDFDVTHPYRQTEVVKALNERIGDAVATGYDVQCVRRVHSVSERPEFFHRPKFGSPQYSETFVSWMVAEYEKDPAFFEKAKATVKAERTESR